MKKFILKNHSFSFIYHLSINPLSTIHQSPLHSWLQGSRLHSPSRVSSKSSTSLSTVLTIQYPRLQSIQSRLLLTSPDLKYLGTYLILIFFIFNLNPIILFE
uniref:Uncharacterized protein n=1 Tax=Cacopsylla melanoneura TaxID=428564 RepID=A0A8D8ZTF8_9HEMI